MIPINNKHEAEMISLKISLYQYKKMLNYAERNHMRHGIKLMKEMIKTVQDRLDWITEEEVCVSRNDLLK